MLAHPTGRLLLKRDGYVIDIPAMLEAAAASATWIEINAAQQEESGSGKDKNGDRAERLRHIRKREAIAPRWALTDELGCDVAKIGVPLV